MKHFIKFKLFLQVSIVFVLGCVATLKAQTADSTLWDGRLYVKIKSKSNVTFKDFKRGEENNLLAEMQPIATKYGLTKIFKPFTSKKEVDFVTTTYEFNFSNIKMYKEMIEDLKAIEYIEYAESVPIYKFINTPNDPFYSGGAQSATNWHLNKINAGNAWGLNGTNANVVTVAVIDNEIDINHPDLINHIWTNQFEIPGNAIDDDWNGRVDDIHGWDFSNGDNNTIGASNFSHGTHCAGLIGAVNNNSVGVSSIGGNNVNVMPIKISLDGNVSVTIDLNSAINGINYATDNGARVISMSFGGSGASTTYQNAVNYAVANGVVCVAAAGNNNASNLFYPAAWNDVIAI